MILVVESNFVLELAFQREEVEHAEYILDLASKGEIDLAVPACAHLREQELKGFC